MKTRIALKVTRETCIGYMKLHAPMPPKSAKKYVKKVLLSLLWYSAVTTIIVIIIIEYYCLSWGVVT